MLFVKKIGQWELSSEAKRSFELSISIFDFLNRELERPFLWGEVVPLQHVCSLVHFARHMRYLQWAQIGLSPHKKVIRQPAEALRDEACDLCITPRTCCLSVLAHGVPLCPAGRIDRHGTLLAFLGSWCAGPTPLRTKDQRSVCLHTVLPNPCWKHLSWQPSFCAQCLGSLLILARGDLSKKIYPYFSQRRPLPGPPGLIHRPKLPLLGGVHDAKPWMEPTALARTGWVTCEALKYWRSCCHKAQHFLESFEWTGGHFLEGSRVALNRSGSLRWDSCWGRNARPQTHRKGTGARIPSLQCRQLRWGQRRQMDGYETSRGHATIWWAHRGLRGRRGMSIGRGLDCAPGETTHPACCEMAFLRQPLSWYGWAPLSFWIWHWVKRMAARGRGQSQSPITPPHPTLPEKGCHPSRCHSHRTRSCRSQLPRDTDHAEWRWTANTLSAVTARHAGIEPTWARLSLAAQILCPAVFSSQVPGRKKTGWWEGRSRSLKRKSSASAERRDWNSRNESSQPRWAQRQCGISPGMSHTQLDSHQHAGEFCTSYNDGAAFATTLR